MSDQKHKVVIIGSGPAGYTAAIYAARANLKPYMITGIKMGGQLMDTTDVENYPGYPDGIMGPQMMEDFRKQAERMGTTVEFGHVSSVDFSDPLNHKIVIDEEREVYAESTIIATGATAKWLGLESEQRLNGSGVSACAVCDGFFYKEQEVALVGGGDTACEEALYLANLCPTVHMFVRRDKMRASKVMQQRVFDSPNIKVYWNTETDEVLGDKEVTGVRVLNNQTNEKTEIPVTGFFVAIGHKPSTELFVDMIDMDEEGYIVAKPDTAHTNIEGVFACGDVRDKIYRQAVTAAGTGCMAALDAERYLSAKEFQMKQQKAVA